MSEPTEGVIILDRKQLLACLNENGFPIKRTYLNRICLPSVNLGPPVALHLARISHAVFAPIGPFGRRL